MLARKKAGVIEVVQYRAGQPASGVAVIVDDEGVAAVYNDTQASWVTVNDGDYIRIDDPDDIYPINADYFAANYDVLEEPAMTLADALDIYNRTNEDVVETLLLGSWDIEPHTEGEAELEGLRYALRRAEQDHDVLYPGLKSSSADCFYCNELRSRIATLLGFPEEQ